MKKIILLGDNLFPSEQTSKFIKSAAILRLADQLRKRNHEVHTLYHFTSFELEEFDIFLKKVSESKTHQIVVGISTSFLPVGVAKNKQPQSKRNDINDLWKNNINKIKLFSLLAKRKYGATIVFGGWAVSQENNICVPFQDFVDYFVVGDGVDSLSKLANNETLTTIKNNHGHNILISPTIKDFSEQSSCPSNKDHILYGESLVTEIASGCIFSCSFCGYGSLGKKKNEFVRSYESLYNEFKYNYDNFGTTFYMFTDNIINDYAIKLEMLTEIRQKLGIDIRWVAYTRLDTIKVQSQVQLLKDAGIAGASFGIESMCKETGRYIGKLTDGEIIKEKLHMCRDIWKDDVEMTGLFIAGLPEENVEELQKTFSFLTSKEGKHLIDHYNFTRLYLPKVSTFIKNNINQNRMGGNPFRDYTPIGNVWEGRWVSPWGTSDEYTELANIYNSSQPDNGGCIPYSFNIPILFNNGIPVNHMMKTMRSQQLLDSVTYKKKIQSNILDYKRKILS